MNCCFESQAFQNKHFFEKTTQFIKMSLSIVPNIKNDYFRMVTMLRQQRRKRRRRTRIKMRQRRSLLTEMPLRWTVMQPVTATWMGKRKLKQCPRKRRRKRKRRRLPRLNKKFMSLTLRFVWKKGAGNRNC